jgi:hypothetical protein
LLTRDFLDWDGMERDFDEERRLRRAAVTRFGVVPEPETDEAGGAPSPTQDQTDEDDNAASQRMEQRALWAELQVRRAMERGDFDDLPGAGKPLRLPDQHDPDWWVKRLIEREKLTGVAPPAIALRREDTELDATLDREGSDEGVRRVVADFNRRVVEARRQLQGGPPVVTPLRDAEAEVAAWRTRREERRERNRRLVAEEAAQAEAARAARGSLLRRLVPRRRGR